MRIGSRWYTFNQALYVDSSYMHAENSCGVSGVGQVSKSSKSWSSSVQFS